jgi:tRNA threonylcarbamoyladenosine biosynthesis protein TsaE
VAKRIVETSDSRQTEALGAELAAALSAGDIVLVSGDLGTGKTTFVRGAARALGVSDPVTSPTFSIGHRYRGADVTVSHLDLYRLGGLHEEEPELLDDYLGPDRIAFIEWPEQSSPELRDARVSVTLTHLGGERRRIEVCERGLSGEPGACDGTTASGTTASGTTASDEPGACEAREPSSYARTKRAPLESR